MVTKFIGIDPGSKSGNIAVITEDTYEYFAFKNTTLHDMYLFCKAHNKDSYAIMEKVHGMPKMNVVAITSLILNRGHMEAMLVATHIPHKFSSPQAWMKHYSMKRDKEETKTQWKNRLKDLAERLMPMAPITRENADAFLIALYAKETYQ